jgi:uncharacterized protein YqgV (UPF0045/DUF77 family)
LAVNRAREGSDIKNLDMGIYLDHVKKRGILISIQTVGRILRPDIKKLKKCGYIIDGFINDGKIEIEIMTAQKILSYYEKVFGLTVENEYNDLLETYKKMKEIVSEKSYDEKTKTIKIKIDDDEKHDTEIKLELITKKFDWSKFTEKLNSIIDKNFGIDNDKKLKVEYEILKEKVLNLGLENKVNYKEYAKTKNMETEPEKKYLNNGWTNYYDFLGIDTSNFPKTLDELKKILKNKNINSIEKYNKKENIEKYNLPEMPEEIQKYGISNIYDIFIIKKLLSR